MKTSLKIKVASIISKLIILLLNEKEIKVKRNNLYWNLDLNEAIDLSIYLTGKFEPQIFKIIKKLSQNGNYDYIDIGANCGVHSIYLAQEFIDSRVIAIEPTNYSFNKLLKNINSNPILKNNIIPIQSFITSSKNLPNEVYSSWELNSEKNQHTFHKGVKKSTTNSKICSLDELVEAYKIKYSIIKCDVDGNELFIFESGKNYLRKYKPKIVMELAPYLYKENGYKADDLFKIIKSFRYNFYDVQNYEKIHSINEYSDKIKVGESKNIYLA